MLEKLFASELSYISRKTNSNRQFPFESTDLEAGIKNACPEGSQQAI